MSAILGISLSKIKTQTRIAHLLLMVDQLMLMMAKPHYAIRPRHVVSGILAYSDMKCVGSFIELQLYLKTYILNCLIITKFILSRHLSDFEDFHSAR